MHGRTSSGSAVRVPLAPPLLTDIGNVSSMSSADLDGPYLDNIEDKTGVTPRQLIDLAREHGFDDPAVKAGTIVAWLKEDYELGHGHAMALVHVIKKGPKIDAKHVGATGSHRDESDTLWLAGKAIRPCPAESCQQNGSAGTRALASPVDELSRLQQVGFIRAALKPVEGQV